MKRAVKRLEGILNDHWLSQLPDVKKEVFIVPLPQFLSKEQPGNATIEGATTGALLVPMPFFNQWKLRCANTFGSVTEDKFQPMFDYLQESFLDPATGVGYVSPWLLGGKSSSIDPESAVIPVRKDAVLWVHYGAQWNDESVGQQALDWVDGLTNALDVFVSDTSWSGIPDLQLGSQTTDPPRLDYVKAYWSSPTHDFVPFLIEVKNEYDPDDLFQFAQSVPLTMPVGEGR